MLTEAEIEWLERRKVLCTHCDLSARGFCGGGKNKLSCQLWEDQHLNTPVKRYKAFQDMQDAAEFEARVAGKLSDHRMESLLPCKGHKEGLCAHPLKSCTWCRMKYARLAAEADMDAQSN